MLKITFKDSEVVFWDEDEFDDYFYDGKVFAIIKGKQWVGLYNIDCIAAIVYSEDGFDDDE